MFNEFNLAGLNIDAGTGERSLSEKVAGAQPVWFAFLSETSEILFGPQNGAPPWESLLAKLIPAVADWCVLSLCNADGAPALFARHRSELAMSPLLAFAPTEGWLTHNGAKEGLEWRPLTTRGESNRVPPVIGLTSYISIPLIFRTQFLGRLTLAMNSNRTGFGERDLAFVRELALRMALALDNARLRAEARRAAESREELMAVVSHDLKNPLTAILVSASLLHDRAKTPDEIQNAKMRRLADSIRHSAERMNGLIGNILDVARLGAGRMQFQLEPVKIGHLMDEIFSRFLPQAMQKNIFLERNVQHGESVINCDPGKIDQVLSNLMTNAVRFTPQDGRIVLRVRETECGFEFSVRDNGPGIPHDKVSSLFDRTGLPKEAARSGTGLGLFIAKGLIELHGGSMWVDSLEGSGSTFCFTLPRTAAMGSK